MPQVCEMMPWYGMIFGPIMMMLAFAAFISAAFLLIRWLGGGHSPSGHPFLPANRSEKTALAILEERFAKGEIENDEFKEKKRLLSE